MRQLELTSQDIDRIAQSPLGDLRLSQIPPNWREIIVQPDLIERVWASSHALFASNSAVASTVSPRSIWQR